MAIDRKQDFLRELADLCALDGVSGHEHIVARRMRSLLEPVVDSVDEDGLGTVYGKRPSSDGRHLMIAAHSDEIGALVAGIEEDGFLRLQTVGGTPVDLLPARKVRVKGHLGVVGVRSGHLPGAERRVDVEQLYVDLGCASADQVQGLGIRPGDQIVWQSELEATANPDRVVGKGIDNRLGCLIVLDVMRALQGTELPGTLTAVIAVQEEVGLKGARVAAQRLRPDAALVIDTTPCLDTPDAGHIRTFPARLGAGPIIQVSSGESAEGFILPEAVRDFVVQAAEEDGIPYQLAPFAFGNTDAGSVYTAAGGIPTVPITIPRRYSHSPVEMLDVNDALAALDLCLAIIRRLDQFPLRAPLILEQ